MISCMKSVWRVSVRRRSAIIIFPPCYPRNDDNDASGSTIVADSTTQLTKLEIQFLTRELFSGALTFAGRSVATSGENLDYQRYIDSLATAEHPYPVFTKRGWGPDVETYFPIETAPAVREIGRRKWSQEVTHGWQRCLNSLVSESVAEEADGVGSAGHAG